MKTIGASGRMTSYEKDPRSDLEGDHVLWVALLTVAREKDPTDSSNGLFGVLHALRCGGAALERDRDFGMLIRPGQWDERQYAEFRAKHLASRKTEVVEALKAAARRLSEVQRDTLKARTAAKVKFAEPRALALGWTKQELWSEKEWDHPDSGERKRSLYVTLMEAAQISGDAELGEVTAQYAEIVVPRLGGSERDVLRVYRVTPAMRTLYDSLADPTASQDSATLKKEAV